MSATGDVPAAERGATLLEMLVVVGILALITGIGFPALMKPYRSLAASVSGSAVTADLRTARAQAERTGRPVSFAVSADGRVYGWPGRTRMLPASVRIAESGPIVFDPDGSSTGGQLALTSPGRRRVLTVDAATGLVDTGAAP